MPRKLWKAAAAAGLAAVLIVALAASPAPPAAPRQGGRALPPPAFHVALPDRALPFPAPRPGGRAEPGFKLIGTKGWAWTPEQFLAEIPVLARYKMNFLMSCYTCVFSDMEKFVNRWWEPLPEKTKRGFEEVVRACRENGITFCYAMHPQLYSPRPLKPDSAEDFEALWQHYAWMQGLGVRWFSLSYDDIDTVHQDMAELGEAHGRLADKLLKRLREKDPGAQLIFCPVFYWGDGEAAPAAPYLRALGRAMDKDILVFWTGDAVVTLKITRPAAEKFRAAVGHRIVIWDNYPVNDRTGALHLGPLTGRDPDLDEVAYGYMSNPHCPQNEINRIPLLTCADYANDPRAYDPARSIGQAIVHLASTEARRRALKDLVELYPGNLISGSTATDYNCVLATLRAILADPAPDRDGRAGAFVARVEDTAARLDREFPAAYAETKKTLAGHIAALRREAAARRRSGPETIRMPLARLRDKIQGGWAGQTIGCTFGGPTEFRFQGTFIPDYQPIAWTPRSLPDTFANDPGLYDDVYMDLTFVDVFAREGLDAPTASFAKAFAEAKYPLWHANQMARYNILRGIMPPASGDWRNNPHADDIDFQIESDFAGLMSPGLPRAAAAIADRIGHIMNYGDGWYGGVYVATMYALAFSSPDVGTVVEGALGAIPPETAFARTMRDAIEAHRRHPDDWKAAWFEIQRRWGQDVGCPEGVFSAFDIDAKINCAWVVLGLLYGEGDFGRTLEVAARCGDDSDCNPATAGGILGAILGYDAIPGAWKAGLREIEEKPFPYTPLSLRDVYRLSSEQAMENIRRHGGRIGDEAAEWSAETPEPVRTEVSFPGMVPAERRRLDAVLKDELRFAFEGVGFAMNGAASTDDGRSHVLRVAMAIDGRPARTWDLPTDSLRRNPTPFWAYGLAAGPHEVRLTLLNAGEKAHLKLEDAVVYR